MGQSVNKPDPGVHEPDANKPREDPDWQKALDVLNRILEDGGVLKLPDRRDDSSLNQQKEFLKQFPFFQLDGDNVSAKTQVQLCTEFDPKENGCSKTECAQLHLCSHYMMGRCKFGNSCLKNHNLQTPHNQKVLAINQLQKLPDKTIVLLLRCSNSSKVRLPVKLVPDLCHFYNTPKGCNKAAKCTYLHVCRDYINGDHGFKTPCSLSHNLLDAQPRGVLQQYKIDTTQTPNALLKLVRKKRRVSKPAGAAAEGDSVLRVKEGGKKKSSVQKQKPTESEAIYVCAFHLAGTCNYAEKCHNIHSEQPYQWQYQDGMTWKNFPGSSNNDIETSFCKAGFDKVILRNETDFKGGVVNFDPMELVVSGGNTITEVRRLAPQAVSEGWRKSYRTSWLWYWKDNGNVWVEYGTQNVKQMKSDIDSNALEEVYQKYLNGEAVRFLKFKTGNHEYSLDLGRKTQENIKFNTERPLRRRPKFQTKQQIQDRMARDFVPHTKIPDSWDVTDPSGDFQRCVISKDMEEYGNIEHRFMETMPAAIIVSIERVQNIELWEDFVKKRDRMEKKNEGTNIKEELLFHGTRHDVVDAICQQNFDWRLSGSRVGARLGQGSYFHKNASYSNDYTTPNPSNERFMFVAKVLAGSTTKGEASLRRPPPKDPSKPLEDLYDTCVDNVNNPKIFVVFDNRQVYPGYIITYKKI